MRNILIDDHPRLYPELRVRIAATVPICYYVAERKAVEPLSVEDEMNPGMCV